MRLLDSQAMFRFLRWFFAVGSMLLLLPAGASAQRNAQDLSTSRALAMGNAFRAVSTSNEAIYFNLAGMALAPRYEVDLTWGFNNETDFDQYNVSIVDGFSTQTATGLAYTRMVGDDLDGHAAHLGFAWALGDGAALGLGLKYLNFSKADDTNAITGDVGLLLRPTHLLSIGLAAYNVIDVYSDEAPFRAGAGVALGSDTSFRLAVDVVFDFPGDGTTATYHVGGEYLLARAFPLRAGYRHDEVTGDNHVSGGIGFVSPTVALEAALAQNVSDGRSEDRTLAFTFKFFL